MGHQLGDAVTIRSYVVDHDEGKEPNPYRGLCTLCYCKFDRSRKGHKNVVELSKAGDWVIGTGGLSAKSAGRHGVLIYAMRIDKQMPREEFSSLYPTRNPKMSSAGLQKLPQFALLSRHFYYFGANAIDIPKKFEGFEKRGPGFRTIDPEKFAVFIEWLKSKYEPGKHGEPCAPDDTESSGNTKCRSSC